MDDLIETTAKWVHSSEELHREYTYLLECRLQKYELEKEVHQIYQKLQELEIKPVSNFDMVSIDNTRHVLHKKEKECLHRLGELRNIDTDLKQIVEQLTQHDNEEKKIIDDWVILLNSNNTYQKIEKDNFYFIMRWLKKHNLLTSDKAKVRDRQNVYMKYLYAFPLAIFATTAFCILKKKCLL